MMGAGASGADDALPWSAVASDSYKTLKAGTAPGELATFGGTFGLDANCGLFS